MNKVEPRLKKEYITRIREELKKENNLPNMMCTPVIKKIVINCGLGEALTDKTVLEDVSGELEKIAGQKPVITKSRGAISGFKIKKGDEIGIKVTLRGNRMWEFLDKLISVVFPRTKDFRGLPADSFDGAGNYTIGIREQTAFPEIDPGQIKKVRSLEITIVTNAKDDKLAKALLDKFGFPFVKDGEKI